MLVLSRKLGEAIVIGENIRVIVVDIRSDNVRLGIEAPKEISKIGWEALTGDVGNVIFLEWPEQIADLLPKKHISITLKHKSETKREITLK